MVVGVLERGVLGGCVPPAYRPSAHDPLDLYVSSGRRVDVKWCSGPEALPWAQHVISAGAAGNGISYALKHLQRNYLSMFFRQTLPVQ